MLAGTTQHNSTTKAKGKEAEDACKAAVSISTLPTLIPPFNLPPARLMQRNTSVLNTPSLIHIPVAQRLLTCSSPVPGSQVETHRGGFLPCPRGLGQ